MTKKAKRSDKSKQSKLVIALAAVVGLMIIGGVVTIVMLAAGSDGNQGPDYDNMSEEEKRELATDYVEAELHKWRAGRESELCSPVIQPILVEYDIVEITASPNRDDGFNRDAFEFTVQLTLTNDAGGRPVVLHRYHVRRSVKDGGWEIQPDTAYFHSP